MQRKRGKKMENKKTVTLAESSAVMNDLYMSFIRNIDVGMRWHLEYLEKKAPSICVKSISSATKTKEFLGGGYEAELPFYVYVKASVESTDDVMRIYSLLNKIAATFEQEQKSGFKNLNFSSITPQSLMMTSTPQEMDEMEDSVGLFGAMFSFKYKTKGRYN